jgi:hypothetical protein
MRCATLTGLRGKAKVLSKEEGTSGAWGEPADIQPADNLLRGRHGQRVPRRSRITRTASHACNMTKIAMLAAVLYQRLVRECDAGGLTQTART